MRGLKAFSAIRSHEWWGYKLPPLLSVAYAVIVHQRQSIVSYWLALLLLLFSLAVGAVYVSLINDLTDLREDRLAGKLNRMEAWPPALRYLSLLPGIGTGVYLICLFSRSQPTGVFYAASWLAFTLYSVPPFRLKKRGVWGVLSDASGAHLFPALFVLYFAADMLEARIDIAMTLGVALWSFCYGLRGILWHQFSDRAHDLKSGVRTLATSLDPERFKVWSLLIFLLELAGLGLILWWLSQPVPLLFLGLYGLMLLLFRNVRGMNFLLTLPAPHPVYHILMSTYYQLLLPVSLLLSNTIDNPRSGIVLVVHLLLFPGNTKRLLKNLWASARGSSWV